LSDALRWLSRGARGRNRFEQKLFPSVIQSEIFNRYLSARFALGRERLLLGEVVRLEGAGAMFRVEDLEKEQARFAAKDLHLTGPMLGPKMRAAGAEALALEQRITAELQLDEAALGALGRNAPGTRRDLLAPLPDLQVEEVTVREQRALRLSFTLPAGGYATEVIRQLTHEPFLANAGSAEKPSEADSTADE
jgi:tRNA pseudouridine13 synthase